MSFLPNNNLTSDGGGHLSLTSSPPNNDNSTKAATTAYVQNAFAARSYNPAAVAMSGGSINNVTIGNTTPSTGSFTTGTIATLTASSNATLSGTLLINGSWIRAVRTVTNTNTIVATATDQVIVVNKTIGAATFVTLPTSPATGRRIVVKDSKGDAANNNINVNPAAGTIDGASTSIINRNYGYCEYIYDGTQWSAINASSGSGTVQTESAEGTTVTTVGPVINASTVVGQPATGGIFNTFALTAGGQILINNSTVSGGNVSTLAYHNHGAFQHAAVVGSFDGWWYWDTTLIPPGWTEYNINAVNLSSTVYPANAPANTVIATISVGFTATGSLDTFAGTFTVSDAVNFKIVGNQLQANATLNQASYSITITANPTPVGNPFTSPIITLT